MDAVEEIAACAAARIGKRVDRNKVLDVLRLTLDGRSPAEIAEQIGISQVMVHNYKRKIEGAVCAMGRN